VPPENPWLTDVTESELDDPKIRTGPIPTRGRIPRTTDEPGLTQRAFQAGPGAGMAHHEDQQEHTEHPGPGRSPQKWPGLGEDARTSDGQEDEGYQDPAEELFRR